jgi:integrase
MATKKQDTRYLYRRGPVWYVKITTPDGRRLVQSTGTGDLTEARAVRDRMTEPLTLTNERGRLAAVQAAIATVDDRLGQIADGLPHLTLLQGWGAFVEAPKGRGARGRAINPGAGSLREMESKWGMFTDWLSATHPTEGPREIRTITPAMADEYITHVGKTRSLRTRNKVLTFLRLILRVIGERAGSVGNPFAEIAVASHATARKRNLSLDQLQALSNAVADTGEMERLFLIGLHTGARLGDVCRLTWHDVDFDAGLLRYTPHKSAKTNRGVTLRMHPALLTNLQGTPKGQRKGAILPELNTLYLRDTFTVSKLVQNVFRKAGIEPSEKVEGCAHRVGRYGFHSLRSSFITTALQRGAVLDDVREAVGHSCLEMTAGYYRGGDAARNVALIGEAPTPTPTATPTATGTADGLGAILDGLRTLDADGLRAVITAAKSALKNGGSK